MVDITARTSFVDYVALAYHEARNVRELVKAKCIPREPYRFLIDFLAKNRERAWKDIQSCRRDALTGDSIGAVCESFEKSYGLTLEELVTMFELPYWKHNAPRYGGNAWIEITKAVRRLQCALMSGDESGAAQLADSILQMKHNTGDVGQKLQRLNDSLRSCGGAA